MRILIVSVWWPPKHGVAVQRPLSWARAWHAQGHDITVLTESVTGDSSDDVVVPAGIEVLRVENPLRRFFPTNSAAANAQSGVAGPWNARTVFTRLLRRLSDRTGVLRSGRMPDPQSLWARRALAALEDRSWDIVISTSGPYPVHFVGYTLRERSRCRTWVADFRDLWADNHIYPGLFPFTLLERHLERRWLAKSDYLCTVSETLAQTLREKHGDKVLVCYNGFALEEITAAASRATPPKAPDSLALVYTGTFYPKLYDVGPLCTALEAIRQRYPELAVTVDVYGRSEAFAAAVAPQACADLFSFHGIVRREESLAAQRHADALIFLGIPGKRGEGVYTGKAFEYLCSGRPILALDVDEGSDVGTLLQTTGSAVLCGAGSARLLAALTSLCDGVTDAERGAPAQPVPEAVMHYERGHQARALLAAIEPSGD